MTRGSIASSSRKGSLWVLAIASALVLSFGLGTAGAHKRIIESNLRLKVNPVSDTVVQLSGTVTSERARCEANRTVIVTANGLQIAETTTLANGDWFAQVTPRPAKRTTLIATTPGKFLKRSTRHKHKCASDFDQRKAP